MYTSKYYDLEKGGGSGWNKADFVWAVEQLETMSREQLIALCKMPSVHLRFSGEHWENDTPEEELISALLADYFPQIVLSAIRDIRAH
jgi:hypothetical protein